MSREQLLSEAFVELADTLNDEFDVLDFLQSLATRSTTIMTASAAAFVLADQHGALQVVASTTHAAEVLQLVALAAHEGPCLDAIDGGEAVVNVSIRDAEQRWPHFTEAASRLGFGAVMVFPMLLRSEALGALSLLFPDERRLGPDDRSIAEALTSIATVGLLQERTPRQREILARQLQAALNLRVVVEQAKGVVAELGGLSVEESFTLIVGYTRTRRRRLGDVAADLVERRLGIDDLTATAD